ncbi:MAG: thrombospondin type 3 repeat-containing protein [Polyangiaceae bacterium]
MQLFRGRPTKSSPRLARAFFSSLIALPALMLAHAAVAQTRVEARFTAERFQAEVGPRNYLVTAGARTDGAKTWSAGMMLHYGYRPFVVRSCVTDEGKSCEDEGAQQVQDVKVVENLITADLIGSYTIIPRLQLGLRLPVMWLNGQGIQANGLPQNDSLTAFSIGDPNVQAKGRLYGEPSSPFVLGAALNIGMPLGYITARHKYIGDRTPTIGARAIIDGKQGPISYAINLGGMYRGDAKVGADTVVGSEMRYGAAAGFQVSPVLRGVVDAFGSTRFSGTAGENTLEVVAAGQVQPMTLPMVFTLGVGTSLIRGVGAPGVRGVLGVMYVAESSDDDKDGIENHADQCPTEPEDLDGYEDKDGCPDRDNDLDSILDSADKCPNQAEDMDGFEDTDGCPDLDNDKDGLADTADQCPGEAETKNGYKDEDGCPDEVDTDNDGIPDARDKCPQEAEDTDGFEDTDGCPDPDNDNDGVPDEHDECVDEPETMNGFQDEDGCPDEAEAPKKKR